MKLNTTSIYGSEIKKYNILTKEEESKIHKDFLNGDTKSKNELITSNLKLVIKIANRYKDMGVDVNELICEGNKGLVIAANRFNPNFDNKFSTYAYFWIKQAIIESIKTNNVWSGLSNNNVLNSEYNYSDKELSVNMDDFQEEYNDQIKIVISLVDTLPKRDCNIIKHYFGIKGYEELNTTEISEKFNISTMRVSNIVEKSIRKIRCNFFENSII